MKVLKEGASDCPRQPGGVAAQDRRLCRGVDGGRGFLRAIGGSGDAPLASWLNLVIYVLVMIGVGVWTMERVRR